MAAAESLPEMEFDPPAAIESPGMRRGPPAGMVIDVTPPPPDLGGLGRESRESVVLPTPQTVKVDRLGRRLEAADEALGRRKDQIGNLSPVRITADEDEWEARVAAIDAERSASPKSASSGGSPKWSRDTAPSVLSAAMNSVLSLDEEQAQAVRSSSPVSSERKAEPPFIAGSTNIVAAPSRGPASPSPSGGGSRLTDSERRARRAQRENKRRSKEAANTKRLLAARQASKQMAEDARKLKAQLRLARRRGMELSHTGGGGHHARFPRSRQVTIGQQVAVGGLNISGGSSNLFGTARTGTASLDGNLMPPAIPVGGAISVRSTRRWSEGTGGIGLSQSLDVLLPNGSYRAAAQRRPGSLSPIQRRARAQNSRAASVPPLGLDSTLDSIDEKSSAPGELDQKERAAAAELAKRQHLQAQLAHRSKMHEEHQATVAQERALRSEQNAENANLRRAKIEDFEQGVRAKGAQRRAENYAKQQEFFRQRAEEKEAANSKGRGLFLANQEQRRERLTHKWQEREQTFVSRAHALQSRFPGAYTNPIASPDSKQAAKRVAPLIGGQS